MRLRGDWLTDPRTIRVFDAIEGAGHRLYYVGGVVRNAALGLPVSDIDLATDARPEAVTEAVEAEGLKPVPTGVDHGTVTVVSDGLAHEVTTFRHDIETDGRRAVVAFSDRIEDDAARRDFTINALYADRQGEVIDTVGGLADLAARRLRFVGDAEARIREDYLRILRYFRFHAHYADTGAGFEPETLSAIAANSAGIETLSAERTGREMLRLLEADDPAPELATMAAVGVLGRVLPGSDPEAVARLVALEQGNTPDALRRLAALGGEDVAERFRLSRAEARRLDDMCRGVESSAGLSEIAWRKGADTALDIALLRAAATGAPLAPDTKERIERGERAEFPLRPADLMPAYDGAALGARLSKLERCWIASGFTLSRNELLALPDS